MDILSRIIYAPRVDLTIALLATALSILAGTTVGVAAGYHRGWLSEGAMRVSDLLQSFPVYVLGMALVVLTGHNVQTLVIAIAVISAPVYARLVRSEVIQLRERLFVDALRASGISSRRIVIKHMLPNAANPIFAMSSVTIGTSILVTAGLSYIGAGVSIPTPEWGSMIAIGTPNLVSGGQWWPSVFPGVALALTVLGFALIGDSLPKVLDPRNRVKASQWALSV
jgi:peptide/nickel transport system permease protein